MRHASSERSLLLPGDAPVPLELPNFASAASVAFGSGKLRRATFGGKEEEKEVTSHTGFDGQDGCSRCAHRCRSLVRIFIQESLADPGQCLDHAARYAQDTKGHKQKVCGCLLRFTEKEGGGEGGGGCVKPYRRVLTRSYEEFGVGHEHIRFCCVPLEGPTTLPSSLSLSLPPLHP